MPVHVIIIGGGIDGLCLAHGLHKAGTSVAVYEKGPRRVDPHWLAGYQIHINRNGAKALQKCLPPALWDSLLASAYVPSAGFQALTEHMKEIGSVDSEIMDGAFHVLIGRASLREVLLQGLEDVINFSKEFVRYERTPNKQVRAFFRAGTTATYGFAAVPRSAWFAGIVVSDYRLLRSTLKASLRVGTSIRPLARRLFRRTV
jgi:2-polyprenyl-6-methoxyphenol hydroxylase-like FAD-dependent oxidoreductase